MASDLSGGGKLFDALAAAFLREGVTTCFALLGDANMNFATRLGEGGSRMIYVRHEHCAVAAAMAYARKSGQIGVATVTCGPGLTQLMTALPAAVRARLPLVILAGEAPLKSAWYNQAIDQAPFVAATGAAYHALHHPETMITAVRDAFLQAARERRPVVLGVPFDLQNRDHSVRSVPVAARDLAPVLSPVPPNADDVARAAKRIDAARRVVVMAGLGAVEAGAGAACSALADRIDGLLATTLPARGLFHDDAFCIGIAGGFSTETARASLGEADLIIAVGTSLARHNADGGALWPKADVLQVDVDPIALSQGRVAADAHLRGDARLGVEALLAAVIKRPAEWRSDTLAIRIATAPADSAEFPAEPGVLDPRDVVSALETHLPADWQMVNSSGHCSFYFAQMPSRPQTHFLTIREFGAIGNGISFAMGVAAARPDEIVVMFDGDGSLLMHIQELETIARHKMNILIVALNDGAYGSEIHKMRADGISDAGAVFGRADLAAIARGFGIGGETVTDLSSLPEMIAQFAEKGGAAVWDVPISDQVVSPVIRRAHPSKTPI